MKASSACLDLIKRFESLRLEAYPDSVGVWTIGYGSTHGVHPGQKINPEQAEALLSRDVEAVEMALSLALHVPATQGQWDALTSLWFNAGAVPRIAPKLWAAVQAGDRETAANEFLDINKAGGKVLPGLTRRREAEREMFLS